MTLVQHNPSNVPAPVGGYSQGQEVRAGSRLLFVSGQIPVRPDGSVPETFEGQCAQAWENIAAVLASAGMELRHLVKVTTYLTDRDQAEANGEIRRRVLGDAQPALTVVVAQTLESPWLLEIEAIAADEAKADD